MTDEVLAKLEALRNATSGAADCGWEWTGDAGCVGLRHRTRGGLATVFVPGRGSWPYRDAEANAEFVAAAWGAFPDLLAELRALREWKASVLNAVRAVPEYTTGAWGGDKEGWGFVFEIIRFAQRDRDRLRSALAELTTMAEVTRSAESPIVKRAREVLEEHRG